MSSFQWPGTEIKKKKKKIGLRVKIANRNRPTSDANFQVNN